jgi:hypothetical protein
MAVWSVLLFCRGKKNTISLEIFLASIVLNRSQFVCCSIGGKYNGLSQDTSCAGVDTLQKGEFTMVINQASKCGGAFQSDVTNKDGKQTFAGQVTPGGPKGCCVIDGKSTTDQFKRLLLPKFRFCRLLRQGHTVRFVVTSPAQGIPPPSLVYFVTADESVERPVALKLKFPADQAELSYGSLQFQWEEFASALYLAQYFEKLDGKPVFSAYTRKPYYKLPDVVLKGIFQPGGLLLEGDQF